MKKRYLGLLIIIGIGFGVTTFINKKTYLSEDDVIGVYINNELSAAIPSKDSALFQKAVCDDENVSATWDSESWGLLLKNLTKKTKCNLYFYSGETVFNFDYTGGEQTFTAPVSGTYKLETWGAQGGGGIGTLKDSGGLGGYSVGNIKVNKNSIFYLSVGGMGQIISDTDKEIISLGGYNGGGNGSRGYNFEYYGGSGGGGATSVQNLLISDGQLKNYENNKSNIIIVSGGGGGLSGYHWMAGSGGGFRGSNSQEVAAMNNDYIYKWGGNSIGATQSTGYALGIGQSASDKKLCGGYGCEGNGGSGSGYYGGFTSTNDGELSNDAGAGGSGYIGNPLLTNKVMYCYNCEESNEESTKTISTTCSEETPTENCAKKGNGYARITLVSIDE